MTQRELQKELEIEAMLNREEEDYEDGKPSFGDEPVTEN